MSLDPFDPMASYRKAMEDAMRPMRELEEQIRRYSVPVLARDYLDALEQTSIQAAARAAQWWRDDLAGSLAARMLEEQERQLDSVLNAAGLLDPRSLAEITKFPIFPSVAEEYASHYLQFRDSVAHLYIDRDAIMSQSALFADQLTDNLRSAFPGVLDDMALEAIRGIDYDAIREATQSTYARILDGFEGPEHDFSPEDWDEVVEGGGLVELRGVVAEAVTSAMRDASDNGLFPNQNVESARFQIMIFMMIISMIIDVIGQPLFEKFLERVAPTKDDAPNAIEVPASSAPVENMPPWFGEGVLIVRSAVNLRIGPSTTQRVVLTIPGGALLRMRKTKGDWLLVEYVDLNGEGSAVTGWVRSRYVRDVGADVWRALWCAIGEPSKASERCMGR